MVKKRFKDGSINSISCGIVCYETPRAQLENLLGSLLAAIRKVNATQRNISATIYVVDNSTEESKVRSVCEESKKPPAVENVEIRYIGGHGNIGYGAAQNLAITSVNSDLHLILNPDVVVNEDALIEGIKAFLSYPSLAMLSPEATNNSGEKQFLCKRFPTVMTLLIRGFLPNSIKGLFRRRLYSYEMQDLSETKLTEGIPLISGCFMLSDTRFLQSIGGFDESYCLYFEDFDLSIRMRSHGTLAYSPSVQITHAGGYAAKKTVFHIRHFLRSGIRFFNKHGWRYR